MIRMKTGFLFAEIILELNLYIGITIMRLIAFSSEIKGLLAHPAINAEADTDNLYEYLTFQFIMGEDTMFKGINKILPGHTMTIDLNSWEITQEKYWEPNFKIDQFHTEEYFIVELKKILQETICQQLRSDVPIGTYLSGGIDSSLVTIVASSILNKQIKSFSGAFKEGPEFRRTSICKNCGSKAPMQNCLRFFQQNRNLSI